MAIIVTAPVTGSLKINNSSASPVSQYFCNMSTVNVIGDPFQQSVNILNLEGMPLYSIALKNLSNVGASGGFATGSLQNAVDAISSLIMK